MRFVGAFKNDKMRKVKINILAVVAVCMMLIYVVVFYDCTPQPEGVSSKTTNGGYVIKVIDGCEYIECANGIFDTRVYSITHKGNCKYCKKLNEK